MTTDEQAKINRLKMPDIGDLLDGRYRIQSVIATGGMGIILRAEQLPMERPVAVKLLHPHVAASSSNVVGRFEQEVKLAKLLNHPNTIRLYDFGESEEGLIYVAMEYLEGVDLKELIAQEGTLSIGRAVDITRQMLDGLAEAHSNDFIHRDLKPSNVFITKNRRGEDFVKLLDFGIAKSLDGSDVDLTASGSICGTPSYVAPEYLENNPLVKASDVYAVGLMLLEMLIGRRVFHGEAPVQTLMMQLKLDPDIPLKISRTKLGPLIRRATAKSPETRYTDADAMLQALEAVWEELPHDLRLGKGDLDELASMPPPTPVDGRGSSLEEDSANALPQARGTPVGLTNNRSNQSQPRIKPAQSTKAAPRLPVESVPVEPVAIEPIAIEPVAEAASGTGTDFRLELPETRQLWKIGAGVLGVVGVIMLALIVIDPGDATGTDEAAGASEEADRAAAVAANEETFEQDKVAPAVAAREQAGEDEGPEPFEFDLDSDPAGATVRVGDEDVGTTPMAYVVSEDELPQTLVFELDGYEPREVEVTTHSSPIVVEVLDKQRKKPASSRSSSKRPKTNKRPKKEKKRDLTDDNVEQVLDEFLVE